MTAAEHKVCHDVMTRSTTAGVSATSTPTTTITAVERMGHLVRLHPRIIKRILMCLPPSDLLELTRTCWTLFVLGNNESLWRHVCLQPPYVDPIRKVSHFSFYGSWKRTALRGSSSSNSASASSKSESWVALVNSALTASADKSSNDSPPIAASDANDSAAVHQEWCRMQGKVYAPRAAEASGLLRNHGAVNYLTHRGEWLRPPTYAFGGRKKRQISASLEYTDNVLIGQSTLEVLPPLHYTAREVVDTFKMKRTAFSGPSTVQTPLLSCPIKDEQTHVPCVVDRRFRLPVSEFIRMYEETNTPVVLTGCIDDWPARHRWQNADTFCQHYANVPLKSNGRSADGRRFRMRAADYFSYALTCTGEKPMYVFDKKVLEDEDGNVAAAAVGSSSGSRISDDFTVPAYFDEDLFALMPACERPDYRWLLIGPDGSGTPFHTDPHGSSAWNAVVSGCKRVTFYPPQRVPPGVDAALIHSDYYASESYMASYRRRLPQLASAAEGDGGVGDLPLEALVFPGDIVFIPSGWWHQVVNYGLTFAVTQNFCSSRTFPRVADDMNARSERSVRRDFKAALSNAGRTDLAVYIDDDDGAAERGRKRKRNS